MSAALHAQRAAKPRIAVLLGDPNGIGPEVGLKLLANPDTVKLADVVLFTDDAIIDAGLATTGFPRSVVTQPGIEVRRLGAIESQQITAGTATVDGGRAALVGLEAAARAVRDGTVDGIVFAPLNKHAMRLAGLAQEDELRLLQEIFGVHGFVSEFNITQGLWTSRVTSHVPLREVADHITIERVVDAIRIVHRYLAASGKTAPRIAVAGLNPHAGDGGSIGREEIDTIAPAIAIAQREGIVASGPASPDTVFVTARRGDYDAVVCMYHDQGQIAMKLMGFEQGVTLHGGLPVPVSTCASGTAFDIVGRNVANPAGLQQAFELAVAIAQSNAHRAPPATARVGVTA